MDAIREQLAARVAELEGQKYQLREALQELTDAVLEVQGRANKIHYTTGLERHMSKFGKARAALKATEEDV